MAKEMSNKANLITGHHFTTKDEAESAWNTYGSELAADISYCGICNRPYEEHALTGAAALEDALTAARLHVDEHGHIEEHRHGSTNKGRLKFSDEEIERVARRVIEIIGQEMTKWLNSPQLNSPKV